MQALPGIKLPALVQDCPWWFYDVSRVILPGNSPRLLPNLVVIGHTKDIFSNIEIRSSSLSGA